MRRLVTSLVFALCLAALPARADTSSDKQLWVNLTTMGTISGDLVYFAEWQPRMGDGLSRLDQMLLRGAVGWKLFSNVTFYQGYSHVVVPLEGRKDANEERSFQQLNWMLGKPWGGELSSRTRLEQRWRSDGDDMGWRLREMLRYEKPLKPGSNAVNALVHSEAFVALNSTDWGAKSGFDQIRTFLGAELGLKGASTVELGYLNQVIDQADGRTRINHVASVSLFLHH